MNNNNKIVAVVVVVLLALVNYNECDTIVKRKIFIVKHVLECCNFLNKDY